MIRARSQTYRDMTGYSRQMITTNELAAQLAALRQQTPTLEELLVTTAFQSWKGATELTTATRFTLLIAPIPVRILSVAVSFEYCSIAASETSYWTGVLEHGDGPAGFPDIAARSTRGTGANANGGITARKAWTWDAATWGRADLAVGELLTVTWTPTGTPAALHLPALYTIRYRAL
jgi:hypothetical protein